MSLTSHGFVRRCPSGKGVSASGNQCSSRQRFSWPRAAACNSARAYGTPTSTKPLRKQPPPSKKGKAGLLQPRPDTDRLPQRASLDRAADAWSPHGGDVVMGRGSRSLPASAQRGETRDDGDEESDRVRDAQKDVPAKTTPQKTLFRSVNLYKEFAYRSKIE